MSAFLEQGSSDVFRDLRRVPVPVPVRDGGLEAGQKARLSCCGTKARLEMKRGLVAVDGKKRLTTSAFARCPRGRSVTLYDD